MTSSRVTAIILAGGQGARIRHLRPDLPKPMIPVHGRPFIEWIVRYLKLQGVTRIVISTGYKSSVIAGHFASISIPGVEVICLAEAEPQGTAGAFLQVISEVSPSDAWLVCNGDSLLLTTLAPLFEALDKGDCSGVLMGVRVSNAANYGSLECDDKNILKGFTEKKPGQGLINAGIYLFKNEIALFFPVRRPLGFEKDVFPFLISTGIPLKALPASAPFLDIGTPETLSQADEFIALNRSFFDPADHE